MTQVLQYEPVRCRVDGCNAVLNPYCELNFTSKQWRCPFCTSWNSFPKHYAQHITEQSLPMELFPQSTTVEYKLPNSPTGPPVFLLVIDTCLDEDELGPLSDALQQALDLLPPQALVGLVTFGTMVHVHELAFTECPKAYVFKGTKHYDSATVAGMLGLGAQGGGAGAVPGAPLPPAPGAERFLMPVEDCSFALASILSDLAKDPWPRPADQRSVRCTGAALSIAESLLEKTLACRGARIMLFTGGPCTAGPGQVVDLSYKETMRSHHDLAKKNAAARFHADARKYYDELSNRCVKQRHVLDVFACSLDQMGLLEMQQCITATGGQIVMADGFGQSVFSESFKRVFTRYDEEHAVPGNAGHLVMGFAGMLEVHTSRDYKIMGALGPVMSLKQKAPYVSENVVGEGGTRVWSLGGVSPSTTVALYFEVTEAEAGARPVHPGARRFLQCITRYQHADGFFRLRVTTHAGMWCPDIVAGKAALAASFDQEAAAVLLGRLTVFRAQTSPLADVLRWLDRYLIRLCSNFAEYAPNDATSFRLPPTFSIFPQFMFHLRRSAFLQKSNSSPDETTYKRLVFNAEDTSNSLVMIQPSLICYSFTGPPTPVLLDATSMRADVILLLDTFFHVIVWHGETIAQWREQRFQDQPEHEAFRNLLQAPLEDAATIMESRFPVPRYVVCDQGKTQARFVLARLNPSVTHHNYAAADVQPIFTDDVSFSTFMEHLTKLAVQK